MSNETQPKTDPKALPIGAIAAAARSSVAALEPLKVAARRKWPASGTEALVGRKGNEVGDQAW